jgi:hypothetical protein
MLAALTALVFGMTAIGCDQPAGPENQQGSEQPAEEGITYVGATDDNTPVELFIEGGAYTVKVGEDAVSSGTATEAADGTRTLQPEDGEPLTAKAGEDSLTLDGPITEGLNGKDLYELYPAEAPPPDDADYSVSLNASAVHVFTPKAQGYADVKALSVIITNTGNKATGSLKAALSGTDSGSFKLNKETIASIAAGKKAAFTVKPVPGLEADTYIAKVTISGGNGSTSASISASFHVRFTVNEADEPGDGGGGDDDGDSGYGIELDVDGGYTFPDAVEGYEEAELVTVAVTNTGSKPTGELTAVLSGPDEGSFTVTRPNPSSLEKESEMAYFNAVPKTDLAAGTYTATVTVSGAAHNSISASFDVSFTVTLVPEYGIELDADGGYTFEDAVEGYGDIAPQAIAVTNTGNQPTGELTAALSDGTAFTLTPTVIDSIAVKGEAEFTVAPAPGLPVGAYTATVTVSGEHEIEASFEVRFTVTYLSYLTLTDGTFVELGVDGLPALCSGTGADASITVNGQSIVKNTITKVVIGPDFAGVTALPNNFCRNFRGLTWIDLSGFTGITRISAYFMRECTAFNRPLVIPEGVTSIDIEFLYGCSAFNNTVTLPSTLTSIGGWFIQKCASFNQQIKLPEGLKTIGTYFMSRNHVLNQPLVIPEGVTSIGDYFMWECRAFNQPLTLPASITNIGYRFFIDCTAFNKPLTILSAANIGANFMQGCNSFNSTLTLTAAKSIGACFMQNCTSFDSTLTIPAATSIGNYFMQSCRAFDQPLTLPAATSIGTYFMQSCTAFNSELTLPAAASIGNYFMQGCSSFDSTLTLQAVTSIGYFFMSGCSAFDQPLELPPSIRSIGNNFLSGYPTAIKFNNTLTLPEGLERIGDALLSDNPSYNKPLTIPSTVKSVGSHFLVNCSGMTSVVTVNCPADAFSLGYSNLTMSAATAAAASYVTGIPIAGPSAADFMARFPNSTSNPYRNLIAASAN